MRACRAHTHVRRLRIGPASNNQANTDGLINHAHTGSTAACSHRVHLRAHQFLKIEPGMFDAYMNYPATTCKPLMEAQKNAGLILD